MLKKATKEETDEIKKVANQLSKTVPYSTKKVFNSFDDSDIYYMISGGFTVISTYCGLIAKDYSSHKAYETVKNMYEDLIDRSLSGLTESEVYAISDYNRTALEVARKTCDS